MEVLVKRLDLFLWQKGQRDTFCPDKGWKQRMYDIKNSVTNSAKNFTGKNSLPGIKKEDYPNGYSSLIQSPTYRADFSGDIVELLNKNINPNLITIPFAINLKSLYDYDKMPAKYESIAREAMNSYFAGIL
jgi:hypothetical protein